MMMGPAKPDVPQPIYLFQALLLTLVAEREILAARGKTNDL